MCGPNPSTGSLMTTMPDGSTSSMAISAPKFSVPDTDAQARIALATQTAGSITSAAGAFAKANAEKAAATNNAKIAEADALNQQRIGDSTAQKLYASTNQLKGTQRASLAARGLDLGSGSPLDILTSTDVMGAADQKTNKENTQLNVNSDLRKAAYYKSQASNVSPFLGAATSLVTGASKVSDKWYDFKKSGNFQNGLFGG